jgi:hypothetical protein
MENNVPRSDSPPTGSIPLPTDPKQRLTHLLMHRPPAPHVDVELSEEERRHLDHVIDRAMHP